MLLFSGIFALNGQNIPKKGVPLLENFPPSDFQNRGKVWEVASAPNGIIYGAADGGLLEFDGKTWKSFKGSAGFTRSVLVINDSVIYTGSDLDFGVWKRNKFLDFEYTSLYPFREDLASLNEEFWQVHRLEDNILFVSPQNIYIFRNGQLTKIPAPSKFTHSFSANDILYFADEKNGLFVLNELSLKQIFSYPEGDSFQIIGAFNDQNGMIIVTRESGLFRALSGKLIPVNSKLSETLKTARVFCFELINNTYPAFGTVLKGLFISDINGRIIHQINKNKGLPNNTILSLHYSSNGKLWMGMDYGISSMNLTTGLTYFFDYRGDFGTGYTALLKDEVFYLGTNQGLYLTGWEDLNNDQAFTFFQIVPGSEGQVWTLKNIDNQLLMGHDRGLFVLEGGRLRRLGHQNGIWTMVRYRQYLLAGTYNGICIFEKSDGDWVFLKRMELVLGSCNQLLIEDENILWVNIPNFGVIRAVLDENLFPVERLIFTEDNFQGRFTSLSKNDEGVLLITESFQYLFNPAEKRFSLIDGEFNYPKVEALLPGIYAPLPLHPDYEFFPVFNGFALNYLGDFASGNKIFALPVFRKMEAFNNNETKLFFPGANIPYGLNNLRVECIVPNQDGVMYQFKIQGADNWSPWKQSNYFDLYNLDFGSYTLLVRAKVDGLISETIHIPFRIVTPWYHSWYAYALYISVMFMAVFLFHSWQKALLKKQKKEMLLRERISLQQQAEKHREEIMLLEQERLKNENELIKQQLKSKTIELANKAKDNEDKNKMLISLKEKFEIAQKDSVRLKPKLKEIQRLLDSFLEKNDKTFEIQMNELHQDFFRKLKERYPDLSTHDLRLCAYLKIGLNTKEIADIFNILPSSAFISRSRLRKKLNLGPEEDLHDFLNAI